LIGHAKEDAITKKWNELQEKVHELDFKFDEPLLVGKLALGLHMSHALVLKELLG
jgi:hypothetical protein